MTTIYYRRRLTRVAAAAVLAFVAARPDAGFAQTQATPELQAQARAVAQACRADFNRLCAGVLPGGGRGFACLQSHTGELTPQCHAVMPRAEALKSQASEAGMLPR